MLTKKDIMAFYDGYKAGECGKYSNVYEQQGRLAAILSLIDLSTMTLVLDMGCGTGWLTRQYANLTHGQAIGIDFSVESVNAAYSKAKEAGIYNVKFIAMDAEELQFGDDSFDCIICSEVIEHLLNPQKALEEMARVVKPDGVVVITTPNPWNCNMVIGTIIREVRNTKGKWSAKGQIYDQPLTPLKLNRMILAAGMKIIKGKGSYYLPPLLNSRWKKLHNIFIRVSTFIEKKNLFSYFGLYQICLLYPVRKFK